MPDGTAGVPAVSVSRVEWGGRMLIEQVRPRDRPDEPGYRHLFDPDTGRLVRQSYGTDELQVVEWSAVTVVPDLDDRLFAWPGPSRELPAGLAG